MANEEKLVAQLTGLKATLVKWEEILVGFKEYAQENAAIIEAEEQDKITYLEGEIAAIRSKIQEVEQKKGLVPNTTDRHTDKFSEALASTKKLVKVGL